MDIIYTYGGGEVLNTTFNAIATILYGKDHFLKTIVNATLLFGSLWGGLYIGILRRWGIPLKWVGWAVILTEVILLPSTEVKIVDVLDHRKPYVIKNVPVVLASVAGFSSSIGYEMTEAFETYFSIPDSYQYNKTGTVFASRLTQQMKQVRIQDAHFARTMKNFLNQCVIQSAMAGITYSVKDIMESKNLWALLKQEAPQSVAFEMYRAGASSILMTCHAGAQEIDKLWEGELAKVSGHIPGLPSLNMGQKDPTAVIKSHFKTLESVLGESSQKGLDLLKQEMMMNEIGAVNDHLLSEYGAGGNYALTKASLQQSLSWNLSGELFAQTVVQLKNVMQTLLISCFLFLIFFLPLPNGWVYLKTYFQFMFALELWGPLNAILNMVMYYHVTAEGSTLLGTEGLNLLTTQGYHNLHSTTVAIAAWMQGLIPFLSYGLVKTGSVALEGLSQNFASATHSAVGREAGELVNANHSLGNISIGSRSLHNTSGFQHNLSPHFNEGQWSSISGDGSQRTTTADGSTIFNEGASISNLGTKVNASDSLVRSLSENVSNSKSNLTSRGQDLSLSAGESIRQATDLMSRLHKGETSSDVLNFSEGLGKSDAYQKATRMADILSNDHGLSKEDAFSVSLQAGLGVPGIAPLSAGVHTNTSGSHSLREAYNHAQNLAKDMGLTESLEKYARSSKDSHVGSNSGSDTSVSDALAKSFDETFSKRDSYMKAQQDVDTWSRMESDVKSGSLTFSKDMSQEYLDYIAQSRVNTGPGGSMATVGYEAARKMIASERDGPYRSSFSAHKLEAMKATYSDPSLAPRESFKPLRSDLENREFTGSVQTPKNASQHIENNREIINKSLQKEGATTPQTKYNEMSNNYEKNITERKEYLENMENLNNKNKELIETTTMGDLAEDRAKRILQSNETLQGAALWVAESLDKSNGARLLKNAGIIDENLGEKYIDKITSPERPFQKMSGIK